VLWLRSGSWNCETSMLDHDFMRWLERRGVRLHGISVSNFEGVRGVIAERDIKEGELLIQVPEPALIGRRAAEADETFLFALNSQMRLLTPLQILAAFLLFECSKGPASYWAPYLAQLPQSYTSFLSWKAQDIAALQVEHAVQEASESCRALLAEWLQAKPLLIALGVDRRWRTVSAWQWAAATLASRTMHMPGEAAGVLTPFGDLHNYLPPPPPHLPTVPGVSGLDLGHGGPAGDGQFDEASREYRLHARGPVRHGDQVFLCYGVHTNLQLLEFYGFQLDDNPHDMALLPAGPLSRAIGTSASGGLRAEDAALHACGMPTWLLLQALRKAAASSPEWKSGAHRAAAGLAVTPAAEVRAFQRLRALCEEVLEALPTSALEDRRQLAEAREAEAEAETKEGSLHCRCLAISWRLKYKLTLHRGMNVAEAALHHLKKSAPS